MDPFGFSPEQYTAAATWASVLVLLGSLVFAWKQVGEARTLREEQARPWVVVRFDPGFIFGITIENIGRTVAKDVKVGFDPPLESTWKRPWGWEESSLLSAGIPMLPPGDSLRFHFDTYTDRLHSDLAMQYAVTVTYLDALGRRLPADSYQLDLKLYAGMAVPPKAMPELVHEVEKLRKEVAKWTDGARGIEVHHVDREKWERRRHRPWMLNKALRVLENDGLGAFLAYLVARLRQRSGLYRQGPR